MKLIIDIGNTAAKVAVFENNEIIKVYNCSNTHLEVLDEVCNSYTIEKCIISSVIDINQKIKDQLNEKPFDHFILNHQTAIPIINQYHTPETLGMDRLAAVIAANDIFPGKDILVIDAGTCITYDLIDSKGNYKGGNISPGVEMRFKALNHFTDKLPLINKEGDTLLYGINTETAIRSGVMTGIEMEIKGYISLLRNNYPRLLVFLTGGNEFSFDTNLKSIIFADKFLVLKGLNRILNYNDKL